MRFKRETKGLWLFVLALMLGRGDAQDQLVTQANWTLHQEDRSWLQTSDPTLIAPRLTTQWEHEDLADGNRKDKVFVNVREAWRLSESLAFGLQAELPIRWTKSAGDRFAGLGDAELRTGIVGRIYPHLRWGVAANGRFDTASDAALGSSGFEWRPVAALRWDARSWLTLGLQPEYTFAANTHNEVFQLKLPVAVELGESWSAEIVYQPKWPQGEDSQRIDLLEFALVHRFGRDKRYAILAGMEIPLSKDDLDWKGFIGLQWFYR
jgi:hypothetical protein